MMTLVHGLCLPFWAITMGMALDPPMDYMRSNLAYGGWSMDIGLSHAFLSLMGLIRHRPVEPGVKLMVGHDGAEYTCLEGFRSTNSKGLAYEVSYNLHP